ncbi:MAG: tyrosine-type recombinase/integrase [Gemmatimonadaceae bacterium]|nr:tyrosine-type recombinase/integrase [Gemmatimonadaceae bacterium]
MRHAADLRGARLHDLRHTAASLAINAGTSLVEVQAMLGRKSARATQRYAKLIPSTGVRAAEKLSVALDAAAKAPVPTVTPITSARRRRA